MSAEAAPVDEEFPAPDKEVIVFDWGRKPLMIPAAAADPCGSGGGAPSVGCGYLVLCIVGCLFKWRLLVTRWILQWLLLLLLWIWEVLERVENIDFTRIAAAAGGEHDTIVLLIR
ncbi:hypothetical protein GGX14DRAFT_611918 [Mycena pura]|uniref:Uncharacterized protein n=1 Tax=Mycena pura TaxID=153505 RepID=A0AAD6YSC5_9AGAR|nr:hypothetical protein GGX14DRAFT_611918 [Mycena pura]